MNTNKRNDVFQDSPTDLSLEYPLLLQAGLTEEIFWNYLRNSFLSDAGENVRMELRNYLKADLRRFCYTFSLLPDIDKKLHVFEIGSNPYYLTLLIKHFTRYELECSNYINEEKHRCCYSTQTVVNGNETIPVKWLHLNIEKNYYRPGNSEGMDVVIFCEVIEHLIESPVKALLNINKMLKKNGCLILSTPNVNRIENVAKMIAGSNIYDPFSGYGEYGRHNREYNKHELNQLLVLCGFELEIMFSSNVHREAAGDYFDISKIMPLIKTIPNRDLDLGQYIFIRAKKVKDAESVLLPEWLYRSHNSMTETAGSNIVSGLQELWRIFRSCR